MSTSEGLTGVVNAQGRLTAPVIANDEDLIPREVLVQRPLPALPVDGSIPPYPFSSSEAVAIPIPVTRVARGLQMIFSVVTDCPGHFSIGASPLAE